MKQIETTCINGEKGKKYKQTASVNCEFSTQKCIEIKVAHA